MKRFILLFSSMFLLLMSSAQAQDTIPPALTADEAIAFCDSQASLAIRMACYDSQDATDDCLFYEDSTAPICLIYRAVETACFEDLTCMDEYLAIENFNDVCENDCTIDSPWGDEPRDDSVFISGPDNENQVCDPKVISCELVCDNEGKDCLAVCNQAEPACSDFIENNCPSKTCDDSVSGNPNDPNRVSPENKDGSRLTLAKHTSKHGGKLTVVLTCSKLKDCLARELTIKNKKVSLIVKTPYIKAGDKTVIKVKLSKRQRKHLRKHNKLTVSGVDGKHNLTVKKPTKAKKSVVGLPDILL